MLHAYLNRTVAGLATGNAVQFCGNAGKNGTGQLVVAEVTFGLDWVAGETGQLCINCLGMMKSLSNSISGLARACRTPAQVAAEELPWVMRALRIEDDSFKAHAKRIADDLRKLANDVERVAARLPLPDSGSGPEAFARKILHDVLWAVPNLNLDGLVQAATEYQRNIEQAGRMALLAAPELPQNQIPEGIDGAV